MFTRCLFPPISNYSSILRKAGIRFDILAENSNLVISSRIDLVRYAARKGTRAAALAAKKARKLQTPTPPPIPKYLQRKVKLAAEFDRKRCTDENWLVEKPIDNVWNMKLYRGKPYTFQEAIDMHRGTHIPSILNKPNALVYTCVEVDLKLKKKDRFMDDFNGVITFPNEFDTDKKNRIIAVCKTPEDQAKAADAGAIYTGSTALIKQILSGAIASDDFDYLVCHPDMYKDINTLRGILKRKFPNTNNGLLRLDVDRAVHSFINGIEYSLKRSAVEPDFGWVDICFGRLNMPMEQLEANFKLALNSVEKHKPAGISHLFIIRSFLWCAKSKDKLKVPHWEYLSNYPENGILVDELSDDEEIVENKTT